MQMKKAVLFGEWPLVFLLHLTRLTHSDADAKLQQVLTDQPPRGVRLDRDPFFPVVLSVVTGVVTG